MSWINCFGVAPGLLYGGGWFIGNHVVKELAHLLKYELLLWDEWGVTSDQLDSDRTLIDQIAEPLLQGKKALEEWLKLFQNPALKVPGQVMCYSPTGNIRPVEIATAA